MIQNKVTVLNGVTYFLLCVDKLEEDVIAGKLYNIFKTECCMFQGLADILLYIEGTMDFFDFPQPYMEKRSLLLNDKKRYLIERKRGENVAILKQYSDQQWNAFAGEAWTFDIVIKSRHNASWQGYVTERKHGKNVPFSSCLELIEAIGRYAQVMEIPKKE